jgi:hypothetical protein
VPNGDANVRWQSECFHGNLIDGFHDMDCQ